MRFVALDVETANADVSSICAIGMALYDEGCLSKTWYSLVNPETFFDGMNISIHGITERDVQDAPTFPQLAEEIWANLADEIVVTHSHFDRASIYQAAEFYGISEPMCRWLDSARVARRTWLECSRRGYGLSSVCQIIGYEFNHHHALEDAKAAAQILMSACTLTGLSPSDWLARVEQPIAPIKRAANPVTREGSPEGALAGEVVVFTGSLSMLRREAADLAADAGCEVDDRVTQKTTLLVVGDIDVTRTGGNAKSRKWQRAEELIADGQEIRILRESDFQKIVRKAERKTTRSL